MDYFSCSDLLRKIWLLSRDNVLQSPLQRTCKNLKLDKRDTRTIEIEPSIVLQYGY